MNILDHIGNARSLIHCQNLASPALEGDRADPFAVVFQVLAVDTILSALGVTLKSKKLLGRLRLHTANLIKSCLPNFGLRTAAMNADQATKDPAFNLVRVLLKPLIFKLFFKGHTPHVAVKIIQEAAGTPSLTWREIICWWENWIEQQDCSLAEKEQMQKDLAQWKILGCDLQGEKMELNLTIALAMLTAIGVIIPPKMENQL